ncbi:MAG: methyltransferase [Planctomycetaceae bacterium]
MATDFPASPMGVDSCATSAFPGTKPVARGHASAGGTGAGDSKWKTPAARRGLLSRMKSFAAAPFRSAAKSLIRRLGRKYRFEIMFGLLLGQYATAIVYVAAKLGIADLLRDGPKTVAELAELTQSDETSLERVMRALATLQVFRRTPDGAYTLSSLGETLLSDSPHTLHDWSIVCGEVLLPTLRGFCESVQTGEKAFDREIGMPLWEYFSQNEEIGRAFDRAMSDYTDKLLPAIVEACDLSGTATVADVGGGRGALITALLAANPHVRGIVYDRAQVTMEAARRIEAAGFSDRCKAVAGSFLESVPTEADAYILKHVLHDWDDEGALTILRNCRQAMDAGNRLLIMEMLTEHREFGRDLACKWYDFIQMSGVGGRERTVAEFESLLRQAGLELCGVRPTKLWDVVILEARPVKLPVA